MTQFFSENPFLLLLCMVCFWPGFIPMAMAYYIGKHYIIRNPFTKKANGHVTTDI